MKTTILICFCVGIIACEPEDPYTKGVKAQEAEAKSGTIIDTVFLGFRFGMSENEFLTHCESLAKQGKIKLTEGVYTYPLEDALEKFDVAFGAEYHEDKMYKLTLQARPAQSVVLAQLTFVPFARKYRGIEVVAPKDQITPCDSYSYYKGNLEISIYCTIYDVVNMVYTDNRIAGKVEDAKEEAKSKKKDDF
jgi:hypothetical protein